MLIRIVGLLSLFTLLSAEEAVCEKCKVIREYNAAHPENNYYYYDDYLKDQKAKGVTGATGASEETKVKVSCGECRDQEEHLACKKCDKKKRERQG